MSSAFAPRRSRRIGLGIAVVALLWAGLADRASAGPVFVVDFEDLAVTTDGEPIRELSVVVPGAFDGQPIVFSREGGFIAFDVIDLRATGPAPGFGSRSLSSDRDLQAERISVSFPGTVQAVSVDIGGFGTDTLGLDLIASRANDLGGPRGTQNRLLPPAEGGAFRSATLSVSGGTTWNFASFGGAPSPYDPDAPFFYTAYVDNLRFELPDAPGNGGGTPVIPLPPALLSFPLAALVAYVAGRRRNV